MHFTKKIIKVEIELVKKSFQSGKKQVTIEGLPIKVVVEKGGLPSFNTAKIEIQGLSLDRMMALSSLAIESMLADERHKVNIYAGDEKNGLSLIFSGDVKSAIPDFSGAPDIVMRLDCFCAYFDAITAQEPIAIKGEGRVADIIGSLVRSEGYTFYNAGVTASVKDCHVSGDMRTKVYKLANAVGAKVCFDDKEVMLAPIGEPFRSAFTKVNKDTGMIGYPTVDDTSVSVSCFFNPSILFGSLVQIESVVPRASGKFQVVKVVHSLSANNPDGGDWFTNFEVLFNAGK